LNPHDRNSKGCTSGKRKIIPGGRSETQERRAGKENIKHMVNLQKYELFKIITMYLICAINKITISPKYQVTKAYKFKGNN